MFRAVVLAKEISPLDSRSCRTSKLSTEQNRTVTDIRIDQTQ